MTGRYKFEPLAIPFAVQGASEGNRDFFWDVEESLKVLFDNENTREEYEQLISDLRNRANRARERPSVGSLPAAERYERHIEGTIETLERYIPGMLAKTPFFSKVFY